MADFNNAMTGDFYIMRYTLKAEAHKRIRQRTLSNAVDAREWYNSKKNEIKDITCYWATPIDVPMGIYDRAHMEIFMEGSAKNE